MAKLYLSFSSLKEFLNTVLPLTLVQIAEGISPVAAMIMIARVGGPNSMAIMGITNFVIYIIFIPIVQAINDIGGVYCSTLFGAKKYDQIIDYFYKTLFTLAVFYFLSGVLFYFSGPILIAMKVEECVAIPAGILIGASMLYLPLFDLNNFMQTFLSSQQIHTNFSVISITSSVSVIGLCYYFIVICDMKEWGFIPAKLIQEGIVFILYFILVYTKANRECLGFPKKQQLFKNYTQFLQRIVMSALSVTGEFFSFEINTYLAALLHNVKDLALWQGFANTTFIPFYISFAIANTFRTNIGNMIGAGDIHKAKRESLCYFIYAFIFSVFVVIWPFLCTDNISSLYFSDLKMVTKLTDSLRLYLFFLPLDMLLYAQFILFRLLKLDKYFMVMIFFVFPPIVILANVILVFYFDYKVEGLVFGLTLCTSIMVFVFFVKIFFLHDWEEIHQESSKTTEIQTELEC